MHTVSLLSFAFGHTFFDEEKSVGGDLSSDISKCCLWAQGRQDLGLIHTGPLSIALTKGASFTISHREGTKLEERLPFEKTEKAVETVAFWLWQDLFVVCLGREQCTGCSYGNIFLLLWASPVYLLSHRWPVMNHVMHSAKLISLMILMLFTCIVL